ncbi:TonB-dependent receptor [Arenimonas sp. GDDSR-1]|uniref:TonB-dependent receptor domain-containing protein n=1 Tax=Arenimonas sp. GDDSR-1 TaxID=2950125 RepID=UPI00260C077A|nr:TonB-dependent receptor [Arenimonas sp. GDDSR-1]
MKSPIRFTVLSSALLFTLQASADDAARSLDRVQVTGNRIAQAAGDAGHSITVLERADIEASRSIDVIDLLGKQTGIDVVRTGGSGSQNSIFIRGGNSNHALILIDGMRVNSATQGLFDFAHLPLALIERIEIVRGPRASVWGSDALSGVIQIFTRAPDSAHAEIRAGSYRRAGLDAGTGIAGEHGRVALSAGFDTFDGFSATTPDNVWSYDPDKDGYRNQHAALQAGTALGTQNLSFTGIATRGDVEFDQGRTQADNHSWNLALSGALSTSWQHKLSLGESYEKLDTPAYASVYGSRRKSLDWSNTLTLDDGTVAFGVNASKESGYSNGWSGPEFKETRDNHGVFGVWNGSYGRQSLELASRWDDNSQFGSRLTSSAAWGLQVSPAGRLRASWGQGFRAPNFNELYYPGFFGSFGGNPNLEPERSQSLEIGYSHAFANALRAEFSAYRSRIDDLIAFEGVNNQAINIQQARIEGAEAELSGSAGAWQWRTQGTWTQAVNETTGNALLRRPKIKGLAELRYRFGNGTELGLEVTGTGKRPDLGSVLPGYGRIDLSASWPLAERWRLEGRIENLGDRDYRLLDGYATPGRSLFLRLNYLAQ